MSVVATNDFQQYKTPRANRSALVKPSHRELLDILSAPIDVGGSGHLEFCGKSLDEARRHARVEVVDFARRFTACYRDSSPLPDVDSSTLVMSGHQPELFHPGVWFKNFLLSELASHAGAIAINFLVDNDVCRNAAIRVPALTAGGKIVTRSIAFDAQRDSVPWEQRRLNDLATWDAFPAAIESAMMPMAEKPLLRELWTSAMDSVRRTDRIGLAIAEARHGLEQKLGLNTLEVPLSCLVSTRAFARFSIQMLSELPRFQDIYNSQLERYRLAHHIRNHAHPVPALEQDAGWLEAPCWIYRESAPQRQRMWVRLLDNQLMLSDRAGWQATIEGRLDCDNAATQWLELLADGVCIRPRALLTTMYLRIMVSDLFVHGIGGGKYDQLTNAIIREFFEIEPPPMAVATATLRLPLNSPLVGTSSSEETGAEIWRLRQELRQVEFDGQRPDSISSSKSAELLQRKREMLSDIPPRGEKWEWHQEMSEINRRLRGLAASEIDELKRSIENYQIIERQQKILESREFSFCLFPMDYIASALSAQATAQA